MFLQKLNLLQLRKVYGKSKHVLTALQHKLNLVFNISGKIRNTIRVQWNIPSVIKVQHASMNFYLGEHLTCVHSNALKDES